MAEILIMNGPNLNILGQREPDMYGGRTLDDINAELADMARELGVGAEFYQSNHEGDLIDNIQSFKGKVLIINAGALSHYSIALLDALKSKTIPIIEVHMTNIYRREEFRRQSLISQAAAGGIYGLGADSYRLALLAAVKMMNGAVTKA